MSEKTAQEAIQAMIAPAISATKTDADVTAELLAKVAKSDRTIVTETRPDGTKIVTEKAKRKMAMVMVDQTDPADLKKKEEAPPTRSRYGDTPLTKSILNVLNGGNTESVERLAFEEDPTHHNHYSSLYRVKQILIPDILLKRISIQDDLVAAIINTRARQVAAFGREQDDRFSTGYKIEPKPGLTEKWSKEEKDQLQDRIDSVVERLFTCGSDKHIEDKDKMSLSEFMYQITRDGLICGRFAVEIVWAYDPSTSKKVFHRFRPVDSATIYHSARQDDAAQIVRDQARLLLEQLKNKKLQPERFKNNEYAWVQVIDGKPVQAFTPAEMNVCNLYPVTDIMLDGYPLTPLDTVISAVTTHINITTHNKMYFQSGRASRGMLVIKSDDIDMDITSSIRQAFNASINNVNNAWRMPVFGIGKDDEVTWTAIDSGQRDMEFQYLTDQNARVILSAFQMSPEELPGYAHLSRGTNNQALSEANNEYKLEAARDVGIRPLLTQIQDFLNGNILKLLDPMVAKSCYIRLVGLDADTPEKESTRLQQDGALHMTYNEILEAVEKDQMKEGWGGNVPLNPAVWANIKENKTFGEIQEEFFGKKDASKDPALAFYQNEGWMQWQQFLQAQQQAQMQAQQPGGAGGGGEGGGGGGQPPPGGKDSGGSAPPENSGPGDQGQGQEEESKKDDDSSGPLESGVNQILAGLTKSEAQLPANKRKILAQHKALVRKQMEAFREESERSLKELAAELVKLAPKKKA